MTNSSIFFIVIMNTIGIILGTISDTPSFLAHNIFFVGFLTLASNKRKDNTRKANEIKQQVLISASEQKQQSVKNQKKMPDIPVFIIWFIFLILEWYVALIASIIIWIIFKIRDHNKI